jgi:pimeloyl-ACP methyl ester carboxylesterase
MTTGGSGQRKADLLHLPLQRRRHAAEWTRCTLVASVEHSYRVLAPLAAVSFSEQGRLNMPAVFVHGVPDTPRLWRPVIESLARKDVATLALPGFNCALPEGFDSCWVEIRLPPLVQRTAAPATLSLSHHLPWDVQHEQ